MRLDDEGWIVEASNDAGRVLGERSKGAGRCCDAERVMLTLDRLVDSPQPSSTLPELTRPPSPVSFHFSVLDNNADLFFSFQSIPLRFPVVFTILLPIANISTSLGRNTTATHQLSIRFDLSIFHSQPLPRSLPSSRAELPVLRLAVMSRRLVVS